MNPCGNSHALLNESLDVNMNIRAAINQKITRSVSGPPKLKLCNYFKGCRTNETF
uniref:Uncharacterized protein n=1 Tax=Onchocerca volvulus TaxID=6282 RepID=A0A8R1TLU5_ONCVO